MKRSRHCWRKNFPSFATTGGMIMNDAVDQAALTRSALREIRHLRAKVADLERDRAEPIAVVGLACRFPGAENAAAFWELLAAGRDAITEVPKERWMSTPISMPILKSRARCIRAGAASLATSKRSVLPSSAL